MTKTFADYKIEAANWITLASGEFYPDILDDACTLYQPVQAMFGNLLKTSESSERLLKQITDVSETWMRIQLNRVFRRYVSPSTPVEMLKRKHKIDEFWNNSSMTFDLFKKCKSDSRHGLFPMKPYVYCCGNTKVADKRAMI